MRWKMTPIYIHVVDKKSIANMKKNAMSSVKFDKIIQESEKIMTNPPETDRVLPVFPGGLGEKSERDIPPCSMEPDTACDERVTCAAFRARLLISCRKKASPQRRFSAAFRVRLLNSCRKKASPQRRFIRTDVFCNRRLS